MSYLVYTPQPSTTAAQATPAPAVVGVAPRYDAFAQDIVLGPDGEPVFGNPWEALADETLMRLLIRRGRSAAFPPNVGLALDLDARQPSRSLREAAIQADITAQVQSDPAVKTVGSFTFTYQSADSLTVAFVVTPVVGPNVPVLVPWSAA